MPDYALYHTPAKTNPERWRIDELLPLEFNNKTPSARLTRRRKKHSDYPDYQAAKAAYDRLTGASDGRP